MFNMVMFFCFFYLSDAKSTLCINVLKQSLAAYHFKAHKRSMIPVDAYHCQCLWLRIKSAGDFSGSKDLFGVLIRVADV